MNVGDEVLVKQPWFNPPKFIRAKIIRIDEKGILVTPIGKKRKLLFRKELVSPYYGFYDEREK